MLNRICNPSATGLLVAMLMLVVALTLQSCAEQPALAGPAVGSQPVPFQQGPGTYTAEHNDRVLMHCKIMAVEVALVYEGDQELLDALYNRCLSDNNLVI